MLILLTYSSEWILFLTSAIFFSEFSNGIAVLYKNTDIKFLGLLLLFLLSFLSLLSEIYKSKFSYQKLNWFIFFFTTFILILCHFASSLLISFNTFQHLFLKWSDSKINLILQLLYFKLGFFFGYSTLKTQFTTKLVI